MQREREATCNPCCCWNIKDGAVTIGIWTVVYSVAQLGIFGWQMAAIKYEMDRAANTLLPNYNTYGRYDVPSYYESYWQSPEQRYYTGLFIVQVLCLISVFFLLFASVALIYGIHTWSRYLMFPWFIFMVASILSSLAYCITWWAGDVRDYWLAITILEIVGVAINVYCVVVVAMFYHRVRAETDYFEGKNRTVAYRSTRSQRSSRRDLLENQFDSFDQYPFPEHERLERARQQQHPAFGRGAYPAQPATAYTPAPPPFAYPPYEPVLKAYPQQLQLPIQMPQPQGPPYPVFDSYEREPGRTGVRRRTTSSYDADDPVGSWVKNQQEIALLSGSHDDAQSEPVCGGRGGISASTSHFPLKHSRSVPSMYDDDGDPFGRQQRHRRHRSSSRQRRPREEDRSERRRPSRHRSSSVGGGGNGTSAYYSSDSETEFGRHRHGSGGSRRRGHRRSHRSRERRPNESESEFTERSTRSHRHQRSSRERGERERERERDRERERERDRERERHVRQPAAYEDRLQPARPHHRPLPEPPQIGNGAHPSDGFSLDRGITIPQHIIIPPSAGERGPDGRIQPQTFQINSEIVIKYDKDDDGNSRVSGLPASPHATHLPLQTRQPLPSSQRIHSNV